jgi:hypothetical protein
MEAMEANSSIIEAAVTSQHMQKFRLVVVFNKNSKYRGVYSNDISRGYRLIIVCIERCKFATAFN